MNSMIQQKSDLRRKIRALNQELRPADIEQADARIRTTIINSSPFQKAQHLICYVSFGREINTQELIQTALADGKTVALPVCLPNRAMEFRIIDPTTNWQLNRYGIFEPANGKVMPKTEIEYAIIPCLACDNKGNRLGQGGGYYDRFLQATTFYKVGLCRHVSLMEEIPTEEQDCKLDEVITEKSRIKC